MMQYKTQILIGLITCCLSSASSFASERFIGEVFFPGGNFCPAGSLKADGASYLNAVVEYADLYALIGTAYGGNGTTTFAVPNMAGRALLGQGRALVGDEYQLGLASDNESYAVIGAGFPSHSHSIHEAIKVGDASVVADHHSPSGESLGLAAQKSYSQQAGACASNMADDAVQLSGKTAKSSAPLSGPVISTVNPYVVMQACIAYQGATPQRGGQ